MAVLHHFPDSNKGPKKVTGERKVFLTFRTRKTASVWDKRNSNHYLTPYTKYNLRQITDLQVEYIF